MERKGYTRCYLFRLIDHLTMFAKCLKNRMFHAIFYRFICTLLFSNVVFSQITNEMVIFGYPLCMHWYIVCFRQQTPCFTKPRLALKNSEKRTEKS